jgi:hypothetical protein
MNTQHTTGPWKATHAISDQDNARYIWTATDPTTGHRELVAMIPDIDGDREHINADANLIASAPDMLQALHAVIALLSDPDADGTDANRVERQILEVIAKATGGAK